MANILILDDNRDLADMLGEYVKTVLNFNVTCVTRSEDFWEAVQSEEFDVLFLDYRLSDTTGIDILDAMRTRGIKIPTIMMTGEGNEKIAASAIQKGAIDYLIKSELSFDTLPAYIDKAIQMRDLRHTMETSLRKIMYQSRLLDNILDAVVVWDRQGIITYWNRAAEELFGQPAEKMIGQAAAQVYFSLFDPPIPADAGTREKLLEERYLSNPDGSLTWISSVISPLYDDPSIALLSGFMDVTRDITSRKIEQETLHTSQNLIQHILDAVPNIIFIINIEENRLKYVSPKINELVGVEWVELVNTDVQGFSGRVHPDDLPRLAAHFAQLRNAKENISAAIEYRFKDNANRWRWLSSLDTVFSRNSKGNVSEILGVFGDISQVKLAENQLRDRLNSEELAMNISARFINMTGENADQEFRWALKTVMLFVKAEFGVIVLNHEDGFNIDYLVQANDAPAEPPVFCEEIEARLLDRLKEGQVFYLQDVAGPEASGKHWLSKMFQTPLRSLLGVSMVFKDQVFGLLIFGSLHQSIGWKTEFDYLLKDIAQVLVKGLVQARYDHDLRKSEEQYRAIVEDHQTELICRITTNLTLTFVNETFCQFFGKDREALVGTSLIDLVPEEDREAFWASIRSISTTSPVTTIEHRIPGPHHKVHWQEWVMRAIRDQADTFSEIQGVGRDITDRKVMEERVRIAQSRLVQSTRLASIGQLASSVAHQISNPLTTIIGDAQLLTRELSADELSRNSAKAIVTAGWRIQQVVDELLKFSQPEQKKPEPVNIKETVQKAILLVGPHIQGAKIDLHVDLPDNLPPIDGYPQKLIDLWVNFFLTAHSSSDTPTKNIWVRSAVKTDQVEISIRDDGPPVPVEQQELIFEPQLLPAGQGRGLGMELSLCREIVHQHGGEISVAIENSCTTFRILFPLRN